MNLFHFISFKIHLPGGKFKLYLYIIYPLTSFGRTGIESKNLWTLFHYTIRHV